MGCCVCTSVEIPKLEFMMPNHLSKQLNIEFVDISLSSEEEEVHSKNIEDWQAFKSYGTKSLTDSVGMMSTLLQSERKISMHSKPGSIVDSFVVSIPQNVIK